MSLVIHVERVILEGLRVSSLDARRFEAALKAELSRVFASDMRRRSFSSQHVRSAGPANVRISNGVKPTHLGLVVARAVHGEIGRLEPAALGTPPARTRVPSP